MNPLVKRRGYGQFTIFVFVGFLGSFIFNIILHFFSLAPLTTKTLNVDYRRRPECTCLRPGLPVVPNYFLSKTNNRHLPFCSHYASQRGPNQRIISISVFGPKVKKIIINQTLNYLRLLIKDVNTIYPDGFILRIYHDTTINAKDVICPVECKYLNVDFCDIGHKAFIPPKIRRFIPAGDPLVDISNYQILTA